MKPIDVDELLKRNPKVDEKVIQDFRKSLKTRKKAGPATVPSPYGRRLPQHGDQGWQGPPRRAGRA